MIEGLRLELRDVAPIARADLDINRINIVGGKNGTGKSTASKLLYCFLKANSSDKDILLTFLIRKELDAIYKEFHSHSELSHKIRRKDSSKNEKNHESIMDSNDYEDETFNDNGLEYPEDYEDETFNDNGLWDPISYGYESFDDNDSWDSNDYGSDMMDEYYESDEYISDMGEEAYISELVDEYYESGMADDSIGDPYGSDIIIDIKSLWDMLNHHDYDDLEELIDFFNNIEPPITEFLEAEVARESARPDPEFGPKLKSFEVLLFKWNNIKRFLHSYEDYSSDFFNKAMNDLISSEFNIDFSFNTGSISQQLIKERPNRINHAKLFDSLNSDFSFEVNLNDVEKFEFKSEGEFFVNNVFYLESYSILDSYVFLKEEYLHIEELRKYLKESLFSRYSNPMGELEKRINKIIGGKIVKDNDGSLRFSSHGNYSSMKNTASGVKQIAVIQTLLHNGFLEDNSVLIIDEPEVNLHPEWQIKLAQILVLLAKEGNIIIYINSHSPMFIEAMDTFSEYYDFEDYVNYYLSEEIGCDKSEDSSEKSEKDENNIIFIRESIESEISSEKLEKDKNRIIFKKIPTDELYVIYDNLGDPFDILDKVRLMKGKKGADDDFYF